MPPDSMPLSSWAPVPAHLVEWKRLTKHFRLLQASFDLKRGAQPLERHGSVLWAATVCDSAVGLCWAWREVRANVIVLEDPMSIFSNIVLLDDADEQMAGYRRLLHLNWTVYSLQWQRHVMRRPAMDHQSTLAAYADGRIGRAVCRGHKKDGVPTKIGTPRVNQPGRLDATRRAAGGKR
jgi:hypothetical protein